MVASRDWQHVRLQPSGRAVRKIIVRYGRKVYAFSRRHAVRLQGREIIVDKEMIYREDKSPKE